jgi:hypothetical protein
MPLKLLDAKQRAVDERELAVRAPAVVSCAPETVAATVADHATITICRDVFLRVNGQHVNSPFDPEVVSPLPGWLRCESDDVESTAAWEKLLRVRIAADNLQIGRHDTMIVVRTGIPRSPVLKIPVVVTRVECL